MSPWKHISARPRLSDGKLSAITSIQAMQSYICTRWTRLLSGWTGCFSASLDGCASGLSSQDACQRGCRSGFCLTQGPEKCNRPGSACHQSHSPSDWTLYVQLHRVGAPPLAHDDGDERGGYNSLPRRSACLDQLWRALLNVSRRLRSRLKRCDTSSLNAPALLLLPVAPNLCQLSRQPNQRQPPWSPDLRRRGAIEGANARKDATTSLSAKDPGPRLPWIQCLRILPDQPGRRRRDPSLATIGPHGKRPLIVSLATSRNAWCREKCVFGSSLARYGTQVSDRCDSGQNKTQTFSKREHASFSASHKHPALMQPVCTAVSTPCHAGRGLAGREQHQVEGHMLSSRNYGNYDMA